MSKIALLTKFLPAIFNLFSKKALYAVLVIAVVGCGWYAYSTVWQQGYDARGAIAIEQERDLLVEQAELRKQHVDEERARSAQAKKHLLEILDNEKQQNIALQRDLADTSNRRVFVSVKKDRNSCDRQTMPRGGSASESVEETERVELSDATVRRLRGHRVEAQQLAIQLNALIEAIEKNEGECLKIID